MNSQSKSPTFIIKTLGCKVNQYESESIRRDLTSNGFLEKEEGQVADFYIINSCTVTHKADRDTRRLIRHFHAINPDAKIAVCGCYVEMEEDRKELSEIAGVDWLVRNEDKKRVAELLALNSKLQIPRNKQISNSKFQIPNFKDRDRVFVKIQDGCNHRCSYCKVSLVRGASISRNESEIIEEIKKILNAGYKEVILTGICLGSWGRDLGDAFTLLGLLEKIKNLDGDFRIRLSSIEPAYVDEGLLDLISGSHKICKHLHIPLQSGDDKILKLMNRGYTVKFFYNLIKKIRKKIPDIAFTTDVLVGFPGEDKKSFKHTYNFIKKLKPSRTHIFSYSKRKGTPSYAFKDTARPQEINGRVKLLEDLAHSLVFKYARKFKGKQVKVLVESKRDKSSELLTGYTDTYIKVLLEGPDSLLSKLVNARIAKVSPKSVIASPGQP